VVSITPMLATARRLVLVRGVHSVHVDAGVADVPHMVDESIAIARDQGFAKPGDVIVIAAGMPFGTAGTTNLLHIARL
jgi:pyruvate kinase